MVLTKGFYRFPGCWLHDITLGITGAALTGGYLQEPIEILKVSLES